jgi:hypothetical protein
MNDQELDRLLASASMPLLAESFNARLLQRINSEAPAKTGNVIAFPAGKRSRVISPWQTVLPLVASMAAALVGGIYLGAATDVTSFLSGSSVASVDDGDFTGFDDLETIVTDGQT